MNSAENFGNMLVMKPLPICNYTFHVIRWLVPHNPVGNRA